MPPDDIARPLKKKGCPICGKLVVPEAAPFCSERCRKIDLGRWLSGSYVIPGDDNDDEADSIPHE